MDLLYQRYASPNEIINRMLKTGRFSEFVENLVRKHNEEASEKSMWEFYLHKVDASKIGFEEFKKRCSQERANTEIDVDELVKDIRKGLKGFKPK